MSAASKRANGRASGPVLTSRFLFVPDHSAAVAVKERSSDDGDSDDGGGIGRGYVSGGGRRGRAAVVAKRNDI